MLALGSSDRFLIDMDRNRRDRDIILVNPYSGEYFDNNHRHKDSLVISFVSFQDINTTSISLEKNTKREYLKDIIKTKMQEEFDGDIAPEPIIKYLISPSTNKDKDIFEVFSIKKDKLKDLFGNFRENLGYIDYIIPESLLFETIFYKTSIIKNENHPTLFLLFKNNYILLSFYKDKKHIYSKSINITLKGAYSKLLKKRENSNMPYDIFREKIRKNLVEHKHIAQDVLREIFLKIEDVLNLTKRAYRINEIDSYAILDSKHYLEIIDYTQILPKFRMQKVDLICLAEQNSYLVKNQVDALLLLNAKAIIEDEYKPLNISIFKKQKAFFKRLSFKLLSCFFVVFLMLSTWLLLQKNDITKLQSKLQVVEHKNTQIDLNTKILKSKIQKLKDRKNILKEIVKQDENILKEKIFSLEKLDNRTKRYVLKSNLIVDLSKYLKKSNLKIDKIVIDFKNNKNETVVNVFGNSSKDIIEFMLLASKDKSLDISIDKIEQNELNYLPKYRSVIRVANKNKQDDI